jgi:hypothetical protein
VGPVSGGTTVTITGTDLAGATAVMFGNTRGRIINDTGTEITVTTPAEAAGPVNVTVTTALGTSGISPEDLFTYVGPPTVSMIGPKVGPVSGGEQVIIGGTNLANAIAVYFGKVELTNFIADFNQEIVVKCPPRGAGTVNVRVLTAGGLSAIAPKDKFTYSAVLGNQALPLESGAGGAGLESPTSLDNGLLTPQSADTAILSMFDDLAPNRKQQAVLAVVL